MKVVKVCLRYCNASLRDDSDVTSSSELTIDLTIRTLARA